MTGTADAQLALDTIEIRRFLEGVFHHSGYDFRNYAFASIRRRVLSRVQAEGTQSVSAIRSRGWIQLF